MSRVAVVPDQVEERPPLPAEHYVVEVQKAELRKSPKGNDTLNLEMIVIDGPDLPEEQGGGSPAGRKLAKSIWIDAKSRDQKNAMDSFGVTAGADGWESEDFVTKQAIASVVITKYDGDNVNQIRKFFPLES